MYLFPIQLKQINSQRAYLNYFTHSVARNHLKIKYTSFVNNSIWILFDIYIFSFTIL